MEETTPEDRELINWFLGQTFPDGPFQVNQYTKTENMAHMVALAIAHVKRGNLTSRALLKELKIKLEQEKPAG